MPSHPCSPLWAGFPSRLRSLSCNDVMRCGGSARKPHRDRTAPHQGAVPKGGRGHEASAPGLINEQWPLHVDAVQSRVELKINTSGRLDRPNNINFNHAQNKIFCLIFSAGK